MAKNFGRNPIESQRLQIVTLDGVEAALKAHYNPSQIQIDQQVPWGEHKTKAGTLLEYTGGAPGRSFNLELLLDCFEEPGENLDGHFETLRLMTRPKDMTSAVVSDRRPPLLSLTNGPIRDLRCILESVSIKVTMFDLTNKPVRAMVSLKLKEVFRSRDGELRLS